VKLDAQQKAIDAIAKVKQWSPAAEARAPERKPNAPNRRQNAATKMSRATSNRPSVAPVTHPGPPQPPSPNGGATGAQTAQEGNSGNLGPDDNRHKANTQERLTEVARKERKRKTQPSSQTQPQWTEFR